MIHRIEIGTKAGLKDARGDGAADGIRTFLDMSVDRVQTRSVLKVYADLTPDEAETVREELTDPVIELSAVGRLGQPAFDC